MEVQVLSWVIFRTNKLEPFGIQWDFEGFFFALIDFAQFRAQIKDLDGNGPRPMIVATETSHGQKEGCSQGVKEDRQEEGRSKNCDSKGTCEEEGRYQQDTTKKDFREEGSPQGHEEKVGGKEDGNFKEETDAAGTAEGDARFET